MTGFRKLAWLFSLALLTLGCSKGGSNSSQVSDSGPAPPPPPPGPDLAVCDDPAISTDVLPGAGSSGEPFVLCLPEHLSLIGSRGYALSANYVMGKDIDLENKPFTPIGGLDFPDEQSFSFRGNFDGRGKKIMNLTVSGGNDSDDPRRQFGNAALFIELHAEGSIQRLVIENFDIRAGSILGPAVAALVAESNGTISRCYISDSDDAVDLSGSSVNDSLGILVGEQKGGEILSSYASGSVNGGNENDDIGVLVGEQSGGDIISSHSSGDVDGAEGEADNVGGLVGEQSGGRIIASHSSGDVGGGAGDYDRVGGLVGSQYSGEIISSYSYASVNGDEGDFDDVGGLVGEQSSSEAHIISSYSSGDVNGGDGDDDVGGLVGRQRAGYLISSYSSGSVNGGDGDDSVGGLVGQQDDFVFAGLAIIASYAVGDADGGGDYDDVGRLVASCSGSGSSCDKIISSYGFGMLTGEAVNMGEGSPPSGAAAAEDLTAPSSDTALSTEAGPEWGGSNSPWSFGSGAPKLTFITGAEALTTTMEIPDPDDPGGDMIEVVTVTGVSYSCADAPVDAFLPVISVTCAVTEIPGQ